MTQHFRTFYILGILMVLGGCVKESRYTRENALNDELRTDFTSPNTIYPEGSIERTTRQALPNPLW